MSTPRRQSHSRQTAHSIVLKPISGLHAHGALVPRVTLSRALQAAALTKCPTGILGLDEITGGGLPRGRTTLVCGGPGCGKTLLGMEFLVRGVMQYDEPGVFVAFEETPDELTQNVASLGFDLKDLAAKKKLVMDYVRIERSEIEETGEYDLEGLFVRLGYAFDTVGAKRVVLDTIESLFSGLPNENILRAELRRLFRWLKERGVTAIVTGERGSGWLTRHGLEEYVSDCVILLDHRIENQVCTRRLRIVKYRGATHGTNEYPFLIDMHGLSILPITSVGLDHPMCDERISTGIPGLDAMFGGKGYYRGSSMFVSGSAGTGKTSVVASCVDAACRRGDRCIYFAFEESVNQIVRDMRSIGLDLQPWIKKGLLHIEPSRPTIHGLEMHLVAMHRMIEWLKPDLVVIDPITNLQAIGGNEEIRSMLTRMVDYFKSQGITALCTGLTHTDDTGELAISSLMDTWILLRNAENRGRRVRTLGVVKSRGMAHSGAIAEFKITDKGLVIEETRESKQ